MSKYGWKSSLAKGKAGEEAFMKLQPGLTKLDGKAADYLDADGNAWELKSDQYPMASTGNFFMERWSDVDALKPGGAWQSWGRGCKYFVYMYIADKTAFVFHTTDLIKAIEEMEKAGTVKPTYILNRNWRTCGYKVPRSALEHLVLKVLKHD